MERGDERRIPGTRAGDQVGLGRVVQNQASIGSPDPEDPASPEVNEASADSFPASDPPGFMSEPPTSGAAGGRPAEGELPDPRDVP